MGKTPAGSVNSRHFATVLAWPRGQSAEDIAATLERAGIGTYDANQLVKRETPFLIGRVKHEWVSDVMPVLVRGGIHVVAFTQDQLESIPAPFVAKCLHAAVGAPKPLYAVEAWRGDGTSLLMEEAFLIIRASVGRTKTTVEPVMRSGLRAPGILLAPELVIAHEMMKGPQELSGTPRVTVQDAAEVVEIFRLDGTRVRVNSEKFSFEMLGKDRGLTGRGNVDQLMLRLAEQAIHAEIDLDFGKFKAPPNTIKTHSSSGVGGASVKTTDSWPSYEFYTQWRYLIQRVKSGLEP